MLLQKWNPETHEYEPFESPAKKTCLTSGDMEEKVDCANCGKEVEYGVTYTSRMIHIAHGFGFPVCEDCSQKESILLSK